MMDADLSGELVGQMLPKTDHISMRAGLECRVPLLDLEVVAIARAMPLSQKRRGSRGKLPLRELLGRRLPARIAQRPKHGFRVPLTSWFRGELADVLQERLLSPKEAAGGVLPRSVVEKLLKEHLTGAAEHSIQLWSLLALQTWMDRHGLQ
jgi:asparagine synthase (glutamine-hydrolysing)